MKLSNAKEVILHENAEWTRVMLEENNKQSLIRYGMVLILIAYALTFLLSLLFTMNVGYIGAFSTTYLITMVVVEFALGIASLYFIPAILAAIAPSFGGKNDSLNALKLFVFAATPSWIGTAVSRIPVLGMLIAIAGAVFAIYLFWQHVAEAMSIPADKKVGYVIVSVVVLAVIFFVIGAIGAAIAAMVSPVSVFHVGY
jgi:Yip1-like protein